MKHRTAVAGLSLLAACGVGVARSARMDFLWCWLTASTFGFLLVAFEVLNQNSDPKAVLECRFNLRALLARWIFADLILIAALTIAGFGFFSEASFTADPANQRLAALVAMAALLIRMQLPPMHRPISWLAEQRTVVFVALVGIQAMNLIVTCRVLRLAFEQLGFSGRALSSVLIGLELWCAGFALLSRSSRGRLLLIFQTQAVAIAASLAIWQTPQFQRITIGLAIAGAMAAVLGIGLTANGSRRHSPFAWLCTASIFGLPLTLGGMLQLLELERLVSIFPRLLLLHWLAVALVGISLLRLSMAKSEEMDSGESPIRFDRDPLGWMLEFAWAPPALACFLILAAVVATTRTEILP